MRQKTPLDTRANEVPECIEHRAHRILSLRSILAHESQITRQTYPFVIREIYGISLS